MNKLFWKFFAAFWLGLVLFSGATFWLASNYLDRISTATDHESPRKRFKERVQTAQLIAHQDGVDALKYWLYELDFKDAIPYYMVNKAGEDLLERSLPDHLLYRLARENHRPKFEQFPRHSNDQQTLQRKAPNRGRVVIPGLGDYRLIADPKGITLARIIKRPRVIALPLLISIISSVLICLLLARYLVRPIKQLQEATREVAKGHFEVWVADSLNHRKDELGDLARDFDLMTAQLKTLIESQQQLLSDVSHELRSPLARLQAAHGLLQKRVTLLSDPDWPAEAREEALQRIDREIEKMSNLISQIISLSRLDTASSELYIERFDLTELVQSIIDDANFEAGFERVGLETRQNLMVSAQRNLLISAIENVIRNAMKYSRDYSTVEVHLSHEALFTDIVICDKGPGVPEDKLENIFDAFTRLDEARQTDQGGHGIGLALAKKIMQKHGGSILAHNRASGGLCVTLRLRVEQ